ncbi:DegT/DnrJ/EryC1/StrS family aminotransferase [Pontimicrobium sp. MEBiC06410]
MNRINVTKTYLPPKEVYQSYLDKVWDSAWLTNRGRLVLELEEKLKSIYNLNSIILTNNGTVPIQIALKLFGGLGEIITTPFSYVATTSSIIWENCTPVFVDIHPDYLTIDETKIESAITDKTTAILATHVYGNPCHIEVIEKIAKKNNLKVIYDAAHCFAVKYKGQPLFNYGDVSTCSFHATKLFHTAEGGAMICNDKEIYHKLFYSHNFGHNGPLEFHGVGINAKMNELQGAMGLAMLPEMNHIINERKKVVDIYNKSFSRENLKTLKLREGTRWNYSYYPVIFNTEETLLRVEEVLQKKEIYARRYFYPSLNKLTFITSNQSMPVSESIAKRVLCLPLYVGLTDKELKLIITTVVENLL